MNFDDVCVLSHLNISPYLSISHLYNCQVAARSRAKFASLLNMVPPHRVDALEGALHICFVQGCPASTATLLGKRSWFCCVNNGRSSTSAEDAEVRTASVAIANAGTQSVNWIAMSIIFVPKRRAMHSRPLWQKKAALRVRWLKSYMQQTCPWKWSKGCYC